MTAPFSNSINIDDTSTTQPSINGQAGHTHELAKPQQVSVLPTAAERTSQAPSIMSKASVLFPRIQQDKEQSSSAGFRPTISALGPSQSMNGTSSSLPNGAASSSISPTATATVAAAANGSADTPKKTRKVVRSADPQSLKRSSGDAGADDKTVRKKRAANPLAMLSPETFSKTLAEAGSSIGMIHERLLGASAVKGRVRNILPLTPKLSTNATLATEPTLSGGGGGGDDQKRFQWPKKTDQPATSDSAGHSPSNATSLPLLPTEGLPGSLNDLMIFLDRFQHKWQDERLELVLYGLTDLDRIQLLLQVTTSPYGHVSTIRDYLQSRCEPRVMDAREALRPTLKTVLNHLACAQKSRTSNAVRILLATTAMLMETITLEVDQVPTSGLYMINETYFRPDEDWPELGQRIHSSIISLKYLAGLWEDVLRRAEDCSYILDLTLAEYESISEALEALREAWEVEGRVDLEEVGSMETKVDRVLRILGRKTRLLKAALRKSHGARTDTFSATSTLARATATSTPGTPATSPPGTTGASTPRATATSTPKATATSTPKATATSTPRATASSTPTATATSTPRATVISMPGVSATSTLGGTATSTPGATAPASQPPKDDTIARPPHSLANLPKIAPKATAASKPKSLSQTAGTTIVSASSPQTTSQSATDGNEGPSPMDGLVLSTPQQPKRQPDLKHVTAAATIPNRASSDNASTWLALQQAKAIEILLRTRAPASASASSSSSSTTPALASAPAPAPAPASVPAPTLAPVPAPAPASPTHSRASSVSKQAASPTPSTSAAAAAPINGTAQSSPASRRSTPIGSSRKVVPTLASLSPVRSSFSPSSSASPILHGSSGSSSSSNTRATPGVVYSMFPPYGRVTVGPPVVAPEKAEYREATAMSILTAPTQLVDNTPKELALHLADTNALPSISRRLSTPAQIAPIEIDDAQEVEATIVDDDTSMANATGLEANGQSDSLYQDTHMAEADELSEHHGDDEGEDGEDSLYEPEEGHDSANMITKESDSIRGTETSAGRTQPHEVKEIAGSAASGTHLRVNSNISSESFYDATQAFTGSEDEEDQLVDEDYNVDIDNNHQDDHRDSGLSHKTEGLFGKAQSPVRHESQTASGVQSSRSSSAHSSATRQTKITAHMLRRINIAAAEAVKKEEEAKMRALLERPSWIAADDNDDRETTIRASTGGLSSSATQTGSRATTPARSTTPSSSSSRLSMGPRKSTPTPKEKPAKPEHAPLPIKAALTPEEEALAIERAQSAKEGKIYKMDVKNARVGAVIIPAHLYVAPKTLLTPKYTPEELEALAAKVSLGADVSSSGSGRRSTRRSGASEEPLLDLDMAQSIKKLKMKKETAQRIEKEGSAVSTSSSTSKSTI
ncbi:hypothetical protein EMPS_07152 [Entomortierella parvispora]|uniref:Uncharacterized protein n=1 Tax=Entomortierella parvispora TaxID=205924 RepID=A0A9P3HDP1_9FUNG|nr:hypothetical protein EMPS_07152 [Entomortierella parvispora]